MPTLGEFIARAKHYGYTKHTLRIPEAGATIVYLRRGKTEMAQLVELPPVHENARLTRALVVSLCETADIPPEDFGLGEE